MKMYLIWIAVLVFAAIVWIIWGNSALMVTEITVRDPEIPKDFSGFRIAQISDLHNTVYGRDNEKLLTLLAGTEPDIIVITGDLADSYRTDLDAAEAFAAAAAKIAPCYYVPGNHEGRITEYPRLEQALRDAGVHVLRNEGMVLTCGASSITVLGVDDPDFDLLKKLGDPEEVLRERMELLSDGTEGYTILLSHRPELFDTYVEYGFDLVFAGHAHGGQFRLPWLGGLFVPGQGFFPKYDAGLFHREDTAMVVSRGLGNSSFPFRIYNRPEIVLTILESE